MGGPLIQQGLNATNRVGSTTDNALPRFDGTTGAIQTSGIVVDDSNNVSGAGTLNCTTITSVAVGLTQQYNDAGAAGGPNDILFRNSASPAANDIIGGLIYRGKDSGGNNADYITLFGLIDDPTDASEDGHLYIAISQAGAQVNEVQIALGTIMGAPTGSFKGTGTLNAKDVYNDNVALTCMALSSEFLKDGIVDTDKWDALVPDSVTPARIERAYRKTVPVTQKVLIERLEKTDGGFILTEVEEDRQLTSLMPVWDAHGNGINAVEVPVTEEVDVPERVVAEEVRTPRRHELAHAFKAMLADGFDPREPEQYFTKMQADAALPGMPSRADWEHNGLGMGEMTGRMWLAAEMQAIVANCMWLKLKDHEARIAVLEAGR